MMPPTHPLSLSVFVLLAAVLWLLSARDYWNIGFQTARHDVASTHYCARRRICCTVAARHWRHMLKLFRWDALVDNIPSPIGCAILIEHDGAVWCFTAAHVLAVFKQRPIWIDIDGKAASMRGTLHFRFTGSPNMGDHERDPTDAAVFLLTGRIPKVLTRRALSEGKYISADHDRYVRYVLLGVPANQVQKDRVKQCLTTNLMPIGLRELPIADYNKLGYHRSTHILLGLAKRLVSSDAHDHRPELRRGPVAAPSSACRGTGQQTPSSQR